MMPADEQWRAGIVDDNRRYYNANLSKGMLSLRISLARLSTTHSRVVCTPTPCTFPRRTADRVHRVCVSHRRSCAWSTSTL